MSFHPRVFVSLLIFKLLTNQNCKCVSTLMPLWGMTQQDLISTMPLTCSQHVCVKVCLVLSDSTASPVLSVSSV